MPWEVEYLEEFELWWNDLNDEEQETVAAHVELLEERGPQLPFPYSSGVQTSKYGNMRELRIQHQGKPYRVLYAFDPRRVGILLLGGDKTGNDRWYDESVPRADRLYEAHLEALRTEGMTDG
jgi:hypothetical protein